MRLCDKDFFSTPQQTIAVEPRAPQSTYPMHTHNFNEIFIVTKGSGMHVINDHPYLLYPGTICYIKSEDHHIFDNVENLNLINILYRKEFNFQYLKNIDCFFPNIDEKNTSHWLLTQSNFKKIVNILNELYNCNEEKPYSTECLFLQLLIHLQQDRYTDTGYGDNEQRIVQILRWLNNSFLEEVYWEQLLEKFGISQRTFNRYIKNKLGVSPQNYLIKLRIFYAYFLILKTNKTITEIAYECGFNDSAYFSTCFKNEFSFCPKDIRKTNKIDCV